MGCQAWSSIRYLVSALKATMAMPIIIQQSNKKGEAIMEASNEFPVKNRVNQWCNFACDSTTRSKTRARLVMGTGAGK